MTTPLLQQSPQYAELLRRWNALDNFDELTIEQINEARVIHAQLNEIEYAYRRAALLARWRELCDKRDDDGLTRSERAELFRVNGQMNKLERQNSEQVKTK